MTRSSALNSTRSFQQAQRLYASGQLAEAERLVEAMLHAAPQAIELLKLRAALAAKRFQHAAAAAYMKRCADLRPDDAKLQHLLATMLHNAGHAAEALLACDAALRSEPRRRETLLLKAAVLERMGNAQAAIDVLKPILESSRDDDRRESALTLTRALLSLKQIDRAIAAGEVVARDPTASKEIRRSLLFTLAKAYDRAGDYPLALAMAREAHQLEGAPFDAHGHVRLIDALIRTYSPKNLRRMKRAISRSDLAVFIAGMPRSGTTLLEQIIGSHPQTVGAGELPYIGQIAESLTAQTESFYTYPESCGDLTVDIAERISASHLELIASFGPSASRVIDKAVNLYQHLGLIWQLFPGARVIHIRRDAMDNCLSCHTQHLPTPMHSYAARFDDLALVYRQHERLMNHWIDTLDLPILTIQYEDLVRNQEAESRRLIDFLGLPWDDRCLRYYESGRTVMTLSYDQVNKPIYDSSIGRHKNYGALLDPLREALERHRAGQTS